MSHFAKIENNIVVNVIVAEQADIDTLAGQWIQTSYNTRKGVHYGPDGLPDGGTPLRKNYAYIGCVYDPILDAFYGPPGFPSWTLNPETCYWEPPIPMPPLPPSDPITGKQDSWVWSELTLGWILFIEYKTMLTNSLPVPTITI